MSENKGKLKRVLVIDDDDEYNFLTEDTFQDTDLDCQLTFKLWAQEALDYLEEDPKNFPDLILLDINMPIMNGWEFLEEYENRGYHLKYPTIIAMISSSIYYEDKEKASTYAKVEEYVEKPISEKDIYAIRDKYFSK